MLHQNGFLHNDIKPENIIFDDKENGDVCLIDFGLATKYMDKKGVHKEQKYKGTFSGSLNFTSINSVSGFRKSRRDDMHSLVHLFVFLTT